VRAGLDLFAGDRLEDVVVVADFERPETLKTRVHRAQIYGGAAVTTAQVCRGRDGINGGSAQTGHVRGLSPHLSHATCVGRKWHLSRPASSRSPRLLSRWLPGLQRAVPSAPLDEQFRYAVVLSAQHTCDPGTAGNDGPHEKALDRFARLEPCGGSR